MAKTKGTGKKKEIRHLSECYPGDVYDRDEIYAASDKFVSDKDIVFARGGTCVVEFSIQKNGKLIVDATYTFDEEY